jgi:hypothetical protein
LKCFRILYVALIVPRYYILLAISISIYPLAINGWMQSRTQHRPVPTINSCCFHLGTGIRNKSSRVCTRGRPIDEADSFCLYKSRLFLMTLSSLKISFSRDPRYCFSCAATSVAWDQCAINILRRGINHGDRFCQCRPASSHIWAGIVQYNVVPWFCRYIINRVVCCGTNIIFLDGWRHSKLHTSKKPNCVEMERTL